MLFQRVAIESLGYVLPSQRILSEDLERAIAPTMERLGLAPGRIEELAGIRERRFWEPGVQPSEVATEAAREAIAQAGIDPQQIGCLINTSVSREYLEPSMACLIHGNLGLSPQCMNYDITNACLGFINGICSIAMMIEAGLIDYGLVVDGENARVAVEATIKRLQNPETTLQSFKENFATLTIGSGAVAMVLSRLDVSRTGHRVNGAVTLAATEHNRLCLGNHDEMNTDPTALLFAGSRLMARTWKIAAETLPRWSDEEIALYVPHQVGSQHVAAAVRTVGMTASKMFLNFPTLGNIGPAALPITLAQAIEAGRAQEGDHVGLLGIGSGLNCSLMSVTW